MTTITPLDGGAECILVTMVDGENEVRVHLHLPCLGYVDDAEFNEGLLGLVVKSAKLGLLYEEGRVVAPECASP